MTVRLGSQQGLERKATVTKINRLTGQVFLSIDELGSQSQTKIESKLPALYSNKGLFFGSDLPEGSAVLVKQIHGGEWIISSILPPDGFFSKITSSSYLDDFGPGIILAQVEGKTRWILDPKNGFSVGSSSNYLQIDPNLNIFSNNFGSKWDFSQASRKIDGVVKRDLLGSSFKNFLESPLESHILDKNLSIIGMDPLTKTALSNDGSTIRNPPYVESREMIYEFAQDYYVQKDTFEANNYQGSPNQIIKDNKYEIRTNVLSLSYNYPNHLLEIIKGTSIDTFGNIIDINRNILPLGKDKFSLKEATNKSENYFNIKTELRKSLAFHFELNTRKVKYPNFSKLNDFGRDSSNLFFDIDKEGTLKINIPASSEVGNIPLSTRYNSYSDLLSFDNPDIDPLKFIKSETNQDIFLTGFSANANIKIKNDDISIGEVSPQDRLTNKNLKYGTVYHDVLNTCSEFLSSANYLKYGLKLVNFHEGSRLNSIIKPLDKIVSSEIYVSGDKANAGGRSVDFNCDGFVSGSIGANTIDKQSLWLDCQGSAICNFGRDKQGISFAGNYTGDVLMQIGGEEIDSSKDSRFINLPATYRNGTLEIRVLTGGQINIIRIAQEGIHLISSGIVTVDAQQDMNFRTNGNMYFQAENIVMYPEGPGGGRMIARAPATSIG